MKMENGLVPKVSRQRTYQIKHKADGLCASCPKKAVKWGRCRKHFKMVRAAYVKRATAEGRRVKIKKFAV